MVPTGDIWHPGQISGPGNCLQELKTVDHVPFDFLALLWSQSAAADRQHLQLSLRQEGLLLAIEINKHSLTERCECGNIPCVILFCINVWLIRGEHDLQHGVKIHQFPLQGVLQVR
jgi:hypothetical protein